MRLPSGLIVPDTVSDKHLLLPKIAGGAPVWQLPVKLQRAEHAIGKGKSVSVTQIQNLLQELSPTLMEQWLITDIRVPIWIEVASTGEEQVPLTVSMNIFLKYGSDIVWSFSEQVNNPSINTGPLSVVLSGVAAGNLQQPIPVERGRGLQIEYAATASFKKESSLTIITALAATIVGGNTLEGYREEEGKITYNSHRLSGHRTL